MENTGTGRVSPIDAEEFVEISLQSAEGYVSSADFECTDNEYLTDCAKALCRVITDKPLLDLFQMNANAVFYNLPYDLPRHSLYFATMTVTAAKRAAADYCRKNGIEFPKPENGCSCY